MKIISYTRAQNYLFLIVFLIIIAPTFAIGQQLTMLKAERFGGNGWDFVNGITRLQNGDYMYCGSISGYLPEDSLGLDVTGNINAWVAFTDSLGNISNQRVFYNSDFSTFTSMTLQDNNILISGIFHDSLYLDSILLTSMAYTSGFIAKMNQEGEVFEALPIATNDNYITNVRMTGFNSDKFYLAGVYKDTILIDNTWSPGASGFFISQLTPELQIENPVFFKAGGNINLGGMSSNDFSVVITGTFSDTLSIADTSLIALGKNDAFVAIFNNDLTLNKLELISSPDEVDVKSVVLTEQNQIGIVGSFKSTAILSDSLLIGKGGFDIMAVVWDSTGKLQWVHTIGSLGNDYGWVIAPGNDGSFFVSGSYSHIISIPDENGQMIELSPESFFGNTFLAKYDERGTLKSTFNIPGDSEEFVSELMINKDNTILASGNFFNTIMLTAHDSSNYTVESAGSKDIFSLILKDMCAGYTIDAGPSYYLCPNETLMIEPDFICSGYMWLEVGKLNTPIEVTQPGSYLLMAMNAFGCMAYDTLFVESVPPLIVFAGNDTIIYPGFPLLLHGDVESNQNPIWSSSGNGYFNPSFGPDVTYYPSSNDISNQTLWIILTAEDECGSVSDSLKVEILNDDDGITAFPNPTSDIVTIMYENNQLMQYITITNQTGFVLESNIPVNNFVFSYNLYNQPPGTYLFYITKETGTTCKVVNKL